MSKQIEKAPGYIIVQEAIRQRILAGELVTGQKIAAERDLEKEFGLSRITVNKGIAGLVAEGLLERRHGQGTFVAQQRPEMSQLAMPRLVKFISPLMTTGQAPLRNTFLEGMHCALSERNYDTGIDFYRDATEQRGYLHQADARYHAGFLVFYEPESTVLQELQHLRTDGFPFVLVDAFPQATNMDFVVSDNVAGAGLAVEHLAQLGHRDIVYITRPIDRSSMSDRLTGFIKSMMLCNAPLTSNSIQKLAHAGPAALADVRQTIDTVLALPEPPSALFFSNDDLALEAIDHLLARGVRIPEDISVMGYDNIDRAENSRVPLSTIEQDFYTMGVESAKVLLEKLTGPTTHRPVQLYVKPTLMVRASTGPAQRVAVG